MLFFCTRPVKPPLMKLNSILLAVFFLQPALGQEILNRDSLLRLLPGAPADSSRVHLLIQIGQQFEGNTPERAKYYYREALDLSRRIGYRLGEIKFATNYTYVLNMQGQYDSSLQINLEAVALAKELGDRQYMAKTLFNAGTSYRQLEDYTAALQMYLEAFPIIQSFNDPIMTGQALDIIQGLYTQLKQYRRSIGYGAQSVAQLRRAGNSQQLCVALSNLGMNYSGLRRFDSALICYQEALRLAQQSGDRYSESTLYLNIGDTYLKQEEYEKIGSYMQNALALSREIGSVTSEAIALRGLSYHHFFRKEYELAQMYADSSLALAKANGLKNEQQKTYAHLANISFALGQLRDGERYSFLSTSISDSLLNETIQKQTLEIDKKYQTAIKDNQIRLQQADIQYKTTWNYLLVGGAATLLLILLLVYRNYRHRQRLQQRRIMELETEKQLAATAAVLKGEEQERSRMAKDLHDGLGGMLSGVKYTLNDMKGNLVMTPDNAKAFERSMDMLDSSIREMRRVAHNMMPEALMKFGLDTALSDLCNDINRSGALQVVYQSIGLADTPIEQTTAITVYRIIQELLNNTMKHAAATQALVQISRDGSGLSVTVEDNGKGFDPETLSRARGIGWSNIQNRVEFLKGHWDLESQPGKGTSVHIEFSV
jgi:two-component system NarL family sensor kinase